MRELNITHMVIDDIDDMPLLSGSRFELGDDAGAFTWKNSIAYAEKHPLLNSREEIQEAKEYFQSFGAWSTEEIECWTDIEVQALVIQHIAANIREMDRFDTYEEYEKAVHNGQVSGEVYSADDGQYYASLNN